MKFSFLSNSKKDVNSGFKNNKPHVSHSIKTETRKNGYKRYSHRDGMPSASYRNSSDSSKSNACLIILIVYVIFGYIIYQLIQ